MSDHEALLYRDEVEFATGVRSFVEAGQAAKEPVMIALPAAKLDFVKRALRSTSRVWFVDMCELGRNPARIIPAVSEFVAEQGATAARFLGEPDWPGRSQAERDEIVNHEVHFEEAFGELPVRLLCAYDLNTTPAELVAGAERCHPTLTVDGARRPGTEPHAPSNGYPDEVPPLATVAGEPLIIDLAFVELTDVRETIHDVAVEAGFDPERVDDIVIAVNEVASNSILHGGGSGLLNSWQDQSGCMVIEITDAGHIDDPLVGRYPPGQGLDARGLWLVNQLCDLVQIRSDRSGTVVRTSFLQ